MMPLTLEKKPESSSMNNAIFLIILFDPNRRDYEPFPFNAIYITPTYHF